MNIALTKVDSLVIKPLVNGLKERGIYDCVNMIIVSDHGKSFLIWFVLLLKHECMCEGMTAVNTDQVLFADKVMIYQSSLL